MALASSLTPFQQTQPHSRSLASVFHGLLDLHTKDHQDSAPERRSSTRLPLSSCSPRLLSLRDSEQNQHPSDPQAFHFAVGTHLRLLPPSLWRRPPSALSGLTDQTTVCASPLWARMRKLTFLTSQSPAKRCICHRCSLFLAPSPFQEDLGSPAALVPATPLQEFWIFACHAWAHLPGCRVTPVSTQHSGLPSFLGFGSQCGL